VIQVSPPITNIHEGSSAEQPKNTGTAKKEPLGVFAKLLAGLLRNTRKDPVGINGKAEAAEIPGEIPEEAAAGTGEKISSRKRKKSPSLTGEREAGAAFFLSPGNPNPEAVPLSAEVVSQKDPGGFPRNPLLKTEGGNAKKEPSPDFSGTGEEGLSPQLAGAVKAGVPEEAAADTAVVHNTAPDPGADKSGLSRSRKAAGKEDPRIAAEPSAGSPENTTTPLVSWGEIQNPSGAQPERALPRENRATEGRRRERPGLEVRDFRSSPQGMTPEAGNTLPGRGETLRTETVDLLVELFPGREGTSGERDSAEAKGRPAGFESLLARELRQDLSGDIVRGAQVILRDGGEGTIRLSLKPESLGNVKIRLEMAENKIMGHIIVENDETLRAFEQEIRSLEQAFLDAGFDGADLDMALAYGDGQNGRGGEKSGEEGDFSFFLQTAAASYDAAPERGEEAGSGRNSGYGISQRINMLI
jgi:hypothetical protein